MLFSSLPAKGTCDVFFVLQTNFQEEINTLKEKLDKEFPSYFYEMRYQICGRQTIYECPSSLILRLMNFLLLRY